MLPERKASAFVFKADKENEPWIASKVWGYFNKMNNKITLSGAMEAPVYYQEEALNISFGKDKFIIGERRRDCVARLSFVVSGDCVALSYEKTSNPDESYFIINELDTVNKLVSGEFEIRLKDNRSSGNYYIMMKNDEFSLSYEDTYTH
ncbi:MAG: hypothetical protein JXB00_16715 [Bacteroidales bacterium]|nr:hypothetical protein [Bacteroidales bacterium]